MGITLQALVEFCGGNPFSQAAVASRQFSLDLSWILAVEVQTSEHVSLQIKSTNMYYFVLFIETRLLVFIVYSFCLHILVFTCGQI